MGSYRDLGQHWHAETSASLGHLPDDIKVESFYPDERHAWAALLYEATATFEAGTPCLEALFDRITNAEFWADCVDDNSVFEQADAEGYEREYKAAPCYDAACLPVEYLLTLTDGRLVIPDQWEQTGWDPQSELAKVRTARELAFERMAETSFDPDAETRVDDLRLYELALEARIAHDLMETL